MNYSEIFKNQTGPGFRFKIGGGIGLNKNAQGIEVKDIDNKTGQVKMVWSKMDVVDATGEVIERGAFKKTINEKGPKSLMPRIKWLRDHQPFDGSAGVLTELYEEGDELIAVGKRIDTQLSRDVYEESTKGAISEHSIGFLVPKGKVIQSTEDDKELIIKEVDLWEGSSLTAWGANMFTPVLSTTDEGDTKAKLPVEFKKSMDLLRGEFVKLNNLINSKLSFETKIETQVRLHQIKCILQQLYGSQPGAQINNVQTTDPLSFEDAITIFKNHLKK